MTKRQRLCTEKRILIWQNNKLQEQIDAHNARLKAIRLELVALPQCEDDESRIYAHVEVIESKEYGPGNQSPAFYEAMDEYFTKGDKETQP